jgi:hypothetical protein
LIAKYAVDVALLEAKENRGTPVLRRYPISEPYGRPKTVLFQGIAKAFGCKAVRQMATKENVLVGFESDLDMVEMIYTSLLLQGTHEALLGRSDRTWRTSFWYGFASRAVERVKETRQRVTDDTPGAALVLADRSHEVDSLFRENIGRVQTQRGGTARSAHGYRAGGAAADRADVGTERFQGARKALA